MMKCKGKSIKRFILMGRMHVEFYNPYSGRKIYYLRIISSMLLPLRVRERDIAVNFLELSLYSFLLWVSTCLYMIDGRLMVAREICFYPTA